MVAFIIGNGLTRKGFPLEQLKEFGTVFGCNALYREFIPDYLIAIDQPIIEEIHTSNFPQERFIVPSEDEQLEPASCNPGRPRSNAGVNAIREALKMGYNPLFCLGFDFLIADKKLSTKNIYDHTDCYEPETRASYMDNLNRTKYLQWVCNHNRHTKFYMVYPRGAFTVHTVNAPNITGIYYDNLLRTVLEYKKDN
jgi:hypothetical protein